MKSGKYDDIIDLPHHQSATRPRMSLDNRAAQFSPFAALTGHGSAIAETARLVDKQIILEEDAIAALDMKLHMLEEYIAQHPEVLVTYFQHDEIKQGGDYVTVIGKLKKIDGVERTLLLTSGESIPIKDILEIEGELYRGLGID